MWVRRIDMGGRVLRLGVRVGHVVDCGFAMKLILHIYLWCQDLTMITENVDIIINCAASINFTVGLHFCTPPALVFDWRQ